MFPDAPIHERRIRVMHGLPWPIPATALIRFTDEDLDRLDMAGEAGMGEYWRTLNEIVGRISICPRPQRFQNVREEGW